MKYFNAQEFNSQEIILKLKEKKLTIGVVIPALNEEKTISRIISTFLDSKVKNLINNVYVIDDGSSDDTIMKAKREGANVFKRKDIGDQKYKDYNGKGFAIRDALSLIKEDIIIIYDGDVKNPSINHIIGLSAPLIINPKLVLAKSNFDRNLYLQNKTLKDQGGRMTELLIKPLIGYLFPDLVLFNQPTGGLYAVRKENLKEIEILGESGADISVLINLYKKNGLRCLSEVYIGEIIHNNKTLNNLSKNAFKQIQSLFYLKKGADDFENYSYFYSGKKVDVNSPLIVLEPKVLNNINVKRSNTVAKVIIYNSKGEILLQLRDNNSNIKFPLHWNLIGGIVEEKEIPKETILRELNEELGIEVKNIDFFRTEKNKNVKQYIYVLNIDLDINKIKLNEGLSLKWFRALEIDGLKIGFNYHEILRRFYDDHRNNRSCRTKQKIRHRKWSWQMFHSHRR